MRRFYRTILGLFLFLLLLPLSYSQVQQGTTSQPYLNKQGFVVETCPLLDDKGVSLGVAQRGDLFSVVKKSETDPQVYQVIYRNKSATIAQKNLKIIEASDKTKIDSLQVIQSMVGQTKNGLYGGSNFIYDYLGRYRSEEQDYYKINYMGKVDYLPVSVGRLTEENTGGTIGGYQVLVTKNTPTPSPGEISVKKNELYDLVGFYSSVYPRHYKVVSRGQMAYISMDKGEIQPRSARKNLSGRQVLVDDVTSLLSFNRTDTLTSTGKFHLYSFLGVDQSTPTPLYKVLAMDAIGYIPADKAQEVDGLSKKVLLGSQVQVQRPTTTTGGHGATPGMMYDFLGTYRSFSTTFYKIRREDKVEYIQAASCRWVSPVDKTPFNGLQIRITQHQSPSLKDHTDPLLRGKILTGRTNQIYDYLGTYNGAKGKYYKVKAFGAVRYLPMEHASMIKENSIAVPSAYQVFLEKDKVPLDQLGKTSYGSKGDLFDYIGLYMGERKQTLKGVMGRKTVYIDVEGSTVRLKSDRTKPLEEQVMVTGMKALIYDKGKTVDVGTNLELFNYYGKYRSANNPVYMLKNSYMSASAGKAVTVDKTQDPIYHRVKTGDTWNSLADYYETESDVLKFKNATDSLALGNQVLVYRIRGPRDRLRNGYRRNMPLYSDEIRVYGSHVESESISDPLTLSTVNKETLINKYNRLPNNYSVSLSQITSRSGYYILLEDEAAMQYEKMRRALESEGYWMYAISGYRTKETEADLYYGYINYYGKAWAVKYSAYPRCSEHGAGLAIDISTDYSLTERLEDTSLFYWLSKNAHKYGFILRYPKGKESITGYGYEPWHYRYVGVDLAKTLYEKNLTLEEYYGVSQYQP